MEGKERWEVGRLQVWTDFTMTGVNLNCFLSLLERAHGQEGGKEPRSSASLSMWRTWEAD